MRGMISNAKLQPSDRALGYWAQRHTIPGVFEDIDFLLFDAISGWQADREAKGSLLEVGAFLGKSAIVLGLHSTEADPLIVCDIFEGEGAATANAQENEQSYVDLTRSAFLENYRTHAAVEPVIVQELSGSIRKHVPDGSVRFAHIDGGHLYDVVRDDLTNVRHLLNDEGVVVFDDYRAFHTPGVAAAVWEGVASHGLVPICLTDAKFYGTWGGPEVIERLRGEFRAWLSQRPEIRTGVQRVAGHDVLVAANPRIWTKRRAVKAAVPPLLAEKLLRRPEPFLGG